MLDQEVTAQGEAFLEHYGVKGMRWGLPHVKKG